MLTQEDYWMIQELHQQRVYRGDMAERLGVHRKTVSRALERGGRPSSKRRRERYAKLKPYMETVDKLLKAGVFNAGGLYREIQALGYDGKIRVLRAYLEPKRALRPGRATVRFETEPANQLQYDCGEVFVPLAEIRTRSTPDLSPQADSRRRASVYHRDRLSTRAGDSPAPVRERRECELGHASPDPGRPATRDRHLPP